MDERPPLYVHLLPALIPPGCLAGSTAVVIDVLRATTVMIHALASGSSTIIPCREIDEARAVAERFPPGQVLVGGERGGRPIPGFDLGNSPAEYTPGACRGKTLVMTTTNGTRAILACAEADRVYVAGFVNLAAMARRLMRELDGPEARPVHLVCAGTEGAVSWEDALFAGSLYRAVSYFKERFTPAGNDAARLGLNQDDVMKNIIAATNSSITYTKKNFWIDPGTGNQYFDDLSHALRLGQGGQNVVALGLAADIDDVSRIDRFPIVGRWLPSPEPGQITADA